MILNPLEHSHLHDAAFVNEQKNHLLTNLDHLLGVLHKLDKPKRYYYINSTIFCINRDFSSFITNCRNLINSIITIM